MKPLALAAAAAVALFAVVSASGGAAASRCNIPVTGGSAAERAAALRVVCGMRGSEIDRLQINIGPPDAPQDTLWLAFFVPRAQSNTLPDFLTSIREKWDAHVAAPAIRDTFVRAGLRRVVAYSDVPDGAEPDPESLFGIALPSWGIRRWATGAPSRNLGKHAESWRALQSKLSAIARRYHVRARLVRAEPLGKAPVVWILTRRPRQFLTSRGFDAVERLLHFREARYDGVFIGLVSPQRLALLVWASYRGRQGEGCGVHGRLYGADRLCSSD